MLLGVNFVGVWKSFWFGMVFRGLWFGGSSSVGDWRVGVGCCVWVFLFGLVCICGVIVWFSGLWGNCVWLLFWRFGEFCFLFVLVLEERWMWELVFFFLEMEGVGLFVKIMWLGVVGCFYFGILFIRRWKFWFERFEGFLFGILDNW